jgi:DNA-directed RNA polymerase subunit N (RpoN/RPB10)
MLPPNCKSCNKLFANIELIYIKKMKNINSDVNNTVSDIDDKTIKLFDELDIKKYCCKKEIISNKDVIQYIK